MSMDLTSHYVLAQQGDCGAFVSKLHVFAGRIGVGLFKAFWGCTRLRNCVALAASELLPGRWLQPPLL